MKKRVLRNALFLADQAGERIAVSGRPAPAREDLVAALWPAARNLTAAVRHVDALTVR
jgi:hypothetical protein